ncbi:MAG: hypothetical protein SVR94_11405 [Pseudomonadota bacterium]|nr:hypothetical protein [Pseudomonadota bacterium]
MSDNRLWLVHAPSGKRMLLGARAGLDWGGNSVKLVDFLNGISDWCCKHKEPDGYDTGLGGWNMWDDFILENETLDDHRQYVKSKTHTICPECGHEKTNN